MLVLLYYRCISFIDSKKKLCNNYVTATTLRVVKLEDHSYDTFAQKYLQLYPFAISTKMCYCYIKTESRNKINFILINR